MRRLLDEPRIGNRRLNPRLTDHGRPQSQIPIEMMRHDRSTSVFPCAEGFEDPVREPVFAHEPPDVFPADSIPGIRRQRDPGDVGRTARKTPAGLTDEPRGVRRPVRPGRRSRPGAGFIASVWRLEDHWRRLTIHHRRTPTRGIGPLSIIVASTARRHCKMAMKPPDGEFGLSNRRRC